MDSNYQNYWLKKGTILSGKYCIKDVISEGGFGIVYLGFDTVLKIDVAIKEFFPRRFAARDKNSKMLHPYKGISEDNFQKGLEKFLNEARILAKLNYAECIVTVRDFFYENNTAYIINEHVVGETVKEYVQNNGKIASDKVLEILHPIMLSLGEIHETGLIHRDISPDNIILKEDKAILIDFGAARTFHEQEDKSMTIFFKRGYSAQEQYIKNGKQTAKTDIYALCATMYFMLTGIQPEESVQRTIKDRVIPLSKMKDIELSIGVKNAIMRGMSVSVSERYPSIAALCKDLYRAEKKNLRSDILPRVIVFLISFAISVFLTEKIRHEVMTKAENNLTSNISDEKTTSAPKSDSASESAITVSDTRKNCTIPNVKGKKKTRAIKLIQKSTSKTIKVIVKQKYSNTIPKGKVIRQVPKAGTDYEEGTIKKIQIWVSKGKKKQYIATTPTPQATHRTVESELDNALKNEKNNEEFAGALPW